MEKKTATTVIDHIAKIQFGHSTESVSLLQHIRESIENDTIPSRAKDKILDLVKRLDHLFSNNQDNEAKAIRLVNEMREEIYKATHQNFPKTLPNQMQISFEK